MKRLSTQIWAQGSCSKVNCSFFPLVAMRCCHLEEPRPYPVLLPLSVQVQPPSEALEVSRSMLSERSYSRPPIHHLSAHPSTHPPTHHSIHPSIHRWIHPPIHHPSTHTSIHTFIQPSVHPSIHPSVHLLSIHPSIIHLSTRPSSIHSPIHPSSTLHFFVQPDRWAPRRNAWVHRRRVPWGAMFAPPAALASALP